MAFHPFRTFQRNQKGCMAGATLLAMISFLFLGVIIQLLGGRGGAGRQIETIAECRQFGKITPFELDRFQKEQDVLRRFLSVLYRNTALVDLTDKERMNALKPLGVFAERVARLQSSEQLINNWLLTQYLLAEGLLPPDKKDIETFLLDLTGGYISDAVYDDSVKSVGTSHQTIEYLLARQIMRQQAERRFFLSVGAVSPATRWDWFQRLHRQVTVEAAAVSIDSFIDKVGEPTAEQMNALFEKYKTKKYDPVSPDSGFVMPAKIAFQYVVAEPTQKLLDSITEAAMQEYYEENKDKEFRKPVTPLTEFPTNPSLGTGTRGSSGSALPFPAPGRPVIPTAPATPSVTPSEGGEVPASDISPAIPQEQEGNGEEIDDNSAHEEGRYFPLQNGRMVSTRLASYQVEADSLQGDPADGVNAVNQAGEVSEPIDLSILYKPFDEVKEDIRKTLALEKATIGVPSILEKMRKYAAVYNECFEQSKPIPAMPDLTDFVAEQGLEWKTVPLGDIHAAMRIGLARGLQERQNLIQIFRSPPLKFEGGTFLGSAGQTVVYWITEKEDEKRPEKLDEVKEIVRKRWKEIEAQSWVQKKAEELASEARASGKSLAETFASRSDIPVVETEPFLWKSYGSMPPYMAAARGIPPMLGEVREKGVVVGDSELDNQWIFAPGTDFMETVYSLQIGEIGVAFNQPKSSAYIVRMTSSSPSEEILLEKFHASHPMEYFLAGQPESVSSAFEAWLTEIQSKTGFRWVNKPEARETEMYGGYYE